MRKAELSHDQLLDANLDLLQEKHAIDLVRSLVQWPDVFQNTIKTQEPVTVLTYLFKMTHALSSSYDHLRIVGSEPELKKARMALYFSARQILNNAMRLLGLSPVERYVSIPHDCSYPSMTDREPAECEWARRLRFDEHHVSGEGDQRSRVEWNSLRQVVESQQGNGAEIGGKIGCVRRAQQ